MGRYLGPREKLERRVGTKLFLKGARCQSQKCGVVRKNYPPGVHGKTRKRKKSDFAKQLTEKQKVRWIYGLSETQLQHYYDRAIASKAITHEELLRNIERRIDNVIYKAGFASSHPQARQFVAHGLLLLNGKRVKAPSHEVKRGDTIEVRTNRKGMTHFASLRNEKLNPPKWLKPDPTNLTIEVLSLPEKEDFDATLNPNMIVEFYSK